MKIVVIGGRGCIGEKVVYNLRQDETGSWRPRAPSASTP
jgi:hypothetical protein